MSSKFGTSRRRIGQSRAATAQSVTITSPSSSLVAARRRLRRLVTSPPPLLLVIQELLLRPQEIIMPRSASKTFMASRLLQMKLRKAETNNKIAMVSRVKHSNRQINPPLALLFGGLVGNRDSSRRVISPFPQASISPTVLPHRSELKPSRLVNRFLNFVKSPTSLRAVSTFAPRTQQMMLRSGVRLNPLSF